MKPINLVKISILALLLLVFIPGAAALNGSYTVPSNPGAACWAAQSGSFFDSTYYISITRPETAVYTGLVFQGLNISNSESITNATLSLYFDIEFDTGESLATLYGYDQPLGASFYTSGSQLISSPVTSNLVNLNMTAYAAAGWQSFDVTDIVQEIVNRPYWLISDNLGFVIYAASGQPHRTIVGNAALPTRWAELNITWGELDPGVTQYREYTISPGLTPFTGFFQDAGTNIDLVYLPQTEGARSSSWVGVTTPAYELGNLLSVQQTRGVVYNDTLYMYGLDDDGTYSTHIYTAPLDNLTDWTKAKQMQTVVDASDWFSMGWYAANNSIYCVTAETGGITFRKVNVTDWTASSEVSVITGYGSGSQSGSAILIDDYGTIYIAGGIPGPTDSTTKCAYGYSTDGGATWTMTRATGFGVYSGYPQLAQMYDKTFLIYAINSPVSYVYKYIDQTDLASGWSSSETLDTVSNMNYNDVYMQPDYFSADSTVYRDVIVSTNYQTGASETRLSAAYIYLNSSGVPNVYDPGGYSSLGNHTGVDKQFNTHVWVDNDLYSLYCDSGSPYYTWWADPAYSENSSFTFYNTNPTPASSVYQAYDVRGYGVGNIIIPTDATGSSWVVTTPPNGTEPDPDCLAAATTLEEVKACIDRALGGSDPLDPDPPGYEEDNEYLSRPRTTLYFMAIGLVFLVAPPAFMVYHRRIQLLPIVLLLMLFGLALLWGLPSI